MEKQITVCMMKIVLCFLGDYKRIFQHIKPFFFSQFTFHKKIVPLQN